MVTNTSMQDTKLYTNIQGLKSLTNAYKSNPNSVTKEVAEQFESLLVQMLLESMRSASNAFSNGLFEESQESSMYHDLYDKQLALSLSSSGSIGLAKQVQAFLEKNNALVQPSSVDSSVEAVRQVESLNPSKFNELIPNQVVSSDNALFSDNTANGFNTASDFVRDLWSSAKSAAAVLGTDPKILLAQAALETNWGKSIIRHATGDTTHNLFNIKADGHWKDNAATFNTIEEEGGVLTKQRSKFRSYDSYSDSFADYANFLKQNSRYSEAVMHADRPDQFVAYLQKARYATDEKYSEKIMDIYSSTKFNDLFNQLNLT